MRRSLDHLPAGKRHELEFVTNLLQTALGEALVGRRSEAVVGGRILKIILFGSYARGDWVEDPVGRYFSDYDLLVVVDREGLTDTLEFWEGAEKRLLSALASGARLRTPVSFIVHTLDDVNRQLARGRYFFMDIVSEGIMLFEVDGYPFADAAPLAPRDALAEAANYFEDGADAALQRQELALFAEARGYNSVAAFELHQTAETLYNCVLLVLTLYTPKSHNLIRLRHLAEPLDSRLADVWPANIKFEKRCFELLRAAYVKARYSRHYQITREELDWIGARIDVLRTLVLDICEARLSALRTETESAG